jgi:hypothetical protein
MKNNKLLVRERSDNEVLLLCRWADAVTQVLQAGGVRSAVVADWEKFCGLVVEKLLWSSIFWLLSAALGAEPVRVSCKDSVQEAWRQFVGCR